MKHNNEEHAIGELLYRQSVAFVEEMIQLGKMKREQYPAAVDYLAQLYGVIFRIA